MTSAVLTVDGSVLEQLKRVHLVGIGGIGMSGIAELLVNLGYDVSGSDVTSSPITMRLESLGIRYAEGHDASHVVGAELVVVSTAVPAENPERCAAEERGIPIVTRGAILAELASLKRAVAVVGSHGKTTTSSMVAVVLDAAGLDPTAVIGGRLSAFGSNTRLGRGAVMVVEADESDRSFLQLSPEIAVLTNIDDEHLDAYDDMDHLEASFLEFAQRTARTGLVVACIDDPRVRRVVSQVPGRVVTYGIEDRSADVFASNVVLDPLGSRFRVAASGETPTAGRIDVALSVPGRHNVQNAVAAVAVAVELGVSGDVVARALSAFSGADRRFQTRGEVGGVVVIDDYAHHPTEIAAALATAKLRAPGRLRIVFQPHRYSRTLRLRDRFAAALSAADELIVTDVYAASESPIPGATSDALALAIAQVSAVPVRLVGSLMQAVETVTEDARPGDLILTLGAGSVGTVPPLILEALRRRETRSTS